MYVVWKNISITLKADRWLGCTGAEPPVKFQNDWIFLEPFSHPSWVVRCVTLDSPVAYGVGFEENIIQAGMELKQIADRNFILLSTL